MAIKVMTITTTIIIMKSVKVTMDMNTVTIIMKSVKPTMEIITEMNIIETNIMVTTQVITGVITGVIEEDVCTLSPSLLSVVLVLDIS
ncbi:hypothetical protein [Heyndrickxia ginsengihumi]|uniref:hypothetical protein n=1 Tax=Heyndrickxia ginsengihumi TaxID=363870 RepID=UPI0012DF2F37|nr:hypothetical protein [Heyndrickxia ginsengihumi]